MEKFFYSCLGIDYTELTEFLLHRYGSLSAFYGMPIREFYLFYKKAQMEQKREQMYIAWCVQLPHMDKDHFESFDDYFNRCTGTNLDTRSDEEILAEVEEIRRKMKDGNKPI